MAQDPNRDREIDDPEEISQKQRIKEILNRRAEVMEARDEAKNRALFGGVDEQDALLFYRSHLESLIHELWNVFRSLDDETESKAGEEYLYQKQIATVTIEPPGALRESVGSLQPGAEWPGAKTIAIEGLMWLIDKPGTITASFSVQSLSPPKQITKTRDYVLQWPELDAVLRATLEFIDTAGIDADLTEQEQRTTIDRELLEEVDEWRAKHVEQ